MLFIVFIKIKGIFKGCGGFPLTIFIYLLDYFLIMAKIVLISCVSKKLSHKARVRDLYISPLFRYNLEYAQLLKPDKIYVLSAKYGLLDLEKEIEPYNTTLNTMPSRHIKAWADNVIIQLNKVADLKKDEIIFLAGEKYRRYLILHIVNYKIPLKGLSIGKQLKYLKDKIQDEQKMQ